MLSKFGEQHLVMVNYVCSFNESETGKYFETNNTALLKVISLAHNLLQPIINSLHETTGGRHSGPVVSALTSGLSSPSSSTSCFMLQKPD